MFFLKPNITKLKSNVDIQGLIKALEHKTSDIRTEAQQAIIELLPIIIDDKSATDLLIIALGHKKTSVYKTISELFFDFIDILSPILLLALGNTSPEIKWRSTEVIGRCKFEGALDILCFNLLNDQNGDVKEASKWALESIGGPVALKCLEESKKKDAYNLEASFKGTAVSIKPTQTSTTDKKEKKRFFAGSLDDLASLAGKGNCPFCGKKMKKDQIGLRCEAGHEVVCRNALFPGYTTPSQEIARILRSRGITVDVIP